MPSNRCLSVNQKLIPKTLLQSGYNRGAVSLKGLTQVIAGSTAFQSLVREIREGDARTALGLPRAARPFVVAALQQALVCPIVYVTASVESSRVATDALANLGDSPPLRFTEPNTAFYDTVAPVRDVIAQRSVVLAALSFPSPASGGGLGWG